MNNKIIPVDFTEEATDNFMAYSEAVLTDRAIPSAEDGLLSSNRKLVWTMNQILKMDSKSNTKKSASIVGTCLAETYEHGDQACYGVLVKMVQPFLMRYPIVDGRGNWGSLEANGMEASPRYSESKPNIFMDLLMKDYKKSGVPLKPTYTNENMEPTVLPTAFPNALVNGREGLGM